MRVWLPPALVLLWIAPAAPAQSGEEGEETAERAAAEGAAVDPDILDVPDPGELEDRNPSEDIHELLRAELSMLEAMQALEMDISRRTSQLARLEAQEEVVEADLARMEARFDRLTDELERARALVRRRLKAMIQLKRTEPYQVLFASESHSTFLRRLRALTSLLEADRERVAAYREQLATWRRSREDLDRRRRNLARTRATIEQTLQQLKWDREEKQALLDAVRERAAFHGKLAQEMETVDVELKEELEALRDGDRRRLWFEQHKGNLMMPIWKGEIVGRFGTRVHPEFGTKTVHRGVDIVPDGWGDDRPVKVRAIYWGYVAHVGWLRGLGKTVIIDHTRGYMSLYAHLEAVKVEEGDKVKTGQPIGTMGDSGSLKGRRLYLELRKDGEAIDPAPWLK
ncbi:MAG: murein hydrolase activator EnvC family protein [Myxococcota bacterium]